MRVLGIHPLKCPPHPPAKPPGQVFFPQALFSLPLGVVTEPRGARVCLFSGSEPRYVLRAHSY